MSTWIGIDTGGTLTKLAYLNKQQELTLTAFPSNEMHLVKQWLEEHPQVEEIGLTGGRTEQLRDVLKTMKSIEYIVEFEATLKGVRFLLDKEGHAINQSIITNVGTGTSIHYMAGDLHKRVGGTGVGGGTLIGLSTIMTGISDFDDIKDNASLGNREGVDLLVKDIYQGMDTPIDGNLTASNFGKVGITDQRKFEQNDVLATTQGLIGEVISTLSIQLAVQHHTENIVYIGSTLIKNKQLIKVIEHYTLLKKHKPIFLKDCGFSGAIGALLNIREQNKK